MSPNPSDWQRLGEQLTHRRVELDPRYQNRTTFCTERGLDYRLAYDIEEAKRTNFRSSTLVAIAAAYAVTPESISGVLRGGDLQRVARAAPDPPDPTPSRAPTEKPKDLAEYLYRGDEVKQLMVRASRGQSDRKRLTPSQADAELLDLLWEMDLIRAGEEPESGENGHGGHSATA